MSRTLVGPCLGVVIAVVGCNRAPVLTQRIEARALAADIRLQFNRAAGGSNRAAMADSPNTAVAAARESNDVVQAIARDTQALRAILRDLNYADEIRLLEQFDGRLKEYQKLVENTDLKPPHTATPCDAEMIRLRTRSLAAAGDDDLRALQAALQRHQFRATR